jgi:Transglutaminase-like superfamily
MTRGEKLGLGWPRPFPRVQEWGRARYVQVEGVMIGRNSLLLEKWRRFRKRPPEDRALILLAAVFLPMTGIGLSLFGFRRWKELIEQFSLSGRPPQVLPADLQCEMARRATLAVRSMELHGPTHPNCLERSLTLWWLLRRDGVEGELHIGARKQGERFEAHAWVELRGQVLNDGEEVHIHYARFDAPIAAAEEGAEAASQAGSHTAGEAASHAAGEAASQ